jgi:hypothetical protein
MKEMNSSLLKKAQSNAWSSKMSENKKALSAWEPLELVITLESLHYSTSRRDPSASEFSLNKAVSSSPLTRIVLRESLALLRHTLRRITPIDIKNK